MKPKLLLALDDTGLTVWQIDRTNCRQLARFKHEERHEDVLHNLLQRWPTAPLHLLVDMGTETFQVSTLPPLGGSDRNALLRRKMEHHFPQTPYRNARRQAKGQTWLLSALNERKRPDALLTLLLQEKSALAGIHSVALACQDLLPRLPHIAPQCLLVTPAADLALRHSYFSSGNLLFSRLTTLPADPGIAGSAAAAEIHRTRQFLNSEQQLRRESPLDVLLLTDSSGPSSLAEHLAQQLQAESTLIRVHHKGIPELCKTLNLPAQEGWPALLGCAIARGMIQDHYRPAFAGRYHRLRQFGRLLQLGAASIFIAGTALGFWLLNEGRSLQAQGREIERTLLLEYERKREFDGRLAAAQPDPTLPIAEVIALYQNHIANWPDGEATAKSISRIWADFPQLQLDRFDWQAIHAPIARGKNTPSVECGPAQRIILAGQFAPELAPRQIQSALQQLSDALSRKLGGRAEILDSPLAPASPKQVLRDETERGTRIFQLQLQLPAPCGAQA